MTENVKEILKKAIEAFDSGNVNECIEYCEQAFSLEPEDSNVKIMKVVSMFLSYSYSDSVKISINAFDILKSITDDNTIDVEIKLFLIQSIYAYRNYWEKDNAFWKRYTRYKGDDDGGFAKAMAVILAIFSNDKKYINSFMDDVISLSWLQNSPVFLEYTIENLKDRRIKNISYIKKLIEINKEQEGDVKDLITELECLFKKKRKGKKIINGIKWTVIGFFSLSLIAWILESAL